MVASYAFRNQTNELLLKILTFRHRRAGEVSLWSLKQGRSFEAAPPRAKIPGGRWESNVLVQRCTAMAADYKKPNRGIKIDEDRIVAERRTAEPIGKRIG